MVLTSQKLHLSHYLIVFLQQSRTIATLKLKLIYFIVQGLLLLYQMHFTGGIYDTIQ